MKAKSITYRCKYCNRQIQFKDIDIDGKYMCPYCGNIFANIFANEEEVAHSVDINIFGSTNKKYILKVLDKWYLKSKRDIDTVTGLVHIDNHWYPYSIIFTTDDFKEFFKLTKDEKEVVIK